MRVIGLTGGIACGKSAAAEILGSLGAKISDADHWARVAVQGGSQGLAAVVATFGSAYLTAAGELDRAKLGRLVFTDAAARISLEKIVHPIVGRLTQDQLAAWGSSGVGTAVVMAPLLLEAGLETLVDEVWVITCPPQVQLERLQKRSGLSREEALARVHAQWSQEDKAARADLVIVNDGSLAELAQKLAGGWDKLKTDRF